VRADRRESRRGLLGVHAGPHFIDFCRGPHVPSSSKLKAVKLLSIAGAYWKGDEHNGKGSASTARRSSRARSWTSISIKIEEAKKRDHRKLGRELDLFSIQELAGPGLIFFHPRAGRCGGYWKDWMRDQYVARGYSLVYTPHVARADLWKTSGHYGFYAENMFKRMELDDAEYQLKPMKLPLPHPDLQGPSAELSRPAGAPGRAGHGVPLRAVGRHARAVSRARIHPRRRAHLLHAGADRKRDRETAWSSPWTRCAPTGSSGTRRICPPGTAGERQVRRTPEQWSLGETALRKATERLNLATRVAPDEAAFYGPKIDVKLVDAIGRPWQLSTVQFDFTLPRRFGLEYIAEDGKAHQPLMVHRALYGSVERFFGILLEHYAGAFPVWLAPVQATVLPITGRNWNTAIK